MKEKRTQFSRYSCDRRWLTLLFIVCFITSQAQETKQNDTLEVNNLSPVNITANRLSGNDQQTPLAVSVLNKSFIQEAQQQLSLHESIETVPGVFSLNAENYAQDLRVSIRGFGARAAFGIRGIKLIVDGIPESTPDGQAQVDNLDVGLVDQIEVIRGPASGLYGNAAGGVINIRTELPTQPFLEARTTWGSYGLQRYQLKAGQKLDKLQYMVYGAHTQSNGYRVNSGVENNLLNGRFKFQLDSASSLSLLLNYINSPQADDPGGIQLAQAEEDPQQARDRNVLFQGGETVEQGRAAIAYERSIGESHKIQARGYYLFRDFANKLPFEFGGIVELDRNYWGGGINYRFDGNLGTAGYQLNAGLDIDNQTDQRARFRNLEGEKGDMTLDQAEKFASTGIFLIQELAVNEKLRLNLSTRYDMVNLEAEDEFLSNGDDSGELDFQRFNPSFGIVFSPTSSTNIYGNISSSFETPALSELSANPTGDGGFNAELLPQKALNYEVGVKGFIDKYVKYDLALFFIDVEDELVPYELDAFPGRTFFRNAGNSERIGVELGTTIYLTKGLTANLSYTYSDFTYANYNVSGNILDGNRLPAIPMHAGFVAVNYRHKSGLMLRAQARLVGEMYANDSNEALVESYSVINLRAAYQATFNNWTIEPFFGINNLTDTFYYTNIRINAFGSRFYEPAMPFNVFGGVRIRIGGEE